MNRERFKAGHYGSAPQADRSEPMAFTPMLLGIAKRLDSAPKHKGLGEMYRGLCAMSAGIGSVNQEKNRCVFHSLWNVHACLVIWVGFLIPKIADKKRNTTASRGEGFLTSTGTATTPPQTGLAVSCPPQTASISKFFSSRITILLFFHGLQSGRWSGQ